MESRARYPHTTLATWPAVTATAQALSGTGSIRFGGHPLLPVAGVADVVLHSLGCLPPPASTALATSALRLHGLPVELLKQQLLADRSAPALRALRELDPRAESIVEVDAQHLFRTNGIAFEPQVSLPGIGRVDFLLNGFLIVEIDGFAFRITRVSTGGSRLTA